MMRTLNMEDAQSCPVCSCSDATVLGALPPHLWLRCRACGLDYTLPLALATLEDEDEDEDGHGQT